MNKPLFDLDQPGLQAEVDSYKPGNGLIWPVLFPLKYTPKFDLKGIEGEDGIPVSADRVAFNTKAPLKSRKTVGSWSGQLSKISMSKEKTELEIGEYEDLKTIAAANTEDKQTARYLVDMVYDDVKACNDGADYKNRNRRMPSRVARHPDFPEGNRRRYGNRGRHQLQRTEGKLRRLRYSVGSIRC